MPDENEIPETDQPETPAAEAEQPPAPEPEEPKTTSETEEAPTEERPFDSQGAYTKFTQRVADRFRSLDERLDRVVAAMEGRGKAPEPESGNPQVDDILSKSRVVREQRQEIEALRAQMSAVGAQAATQAILTQFPDLKEDLPTFLEWAKNKPALLQAAKEGTLSDKEVIAAFRASHPAKASKTRAASSESRKPVPKVEGEPRPAGTSRDPRQVLRERGIARPTLDQVFDEAASQARRELARG